MGSSAFARNREDDSRIGIRTPTLASVLSLILVFAAGSLWPVSMQTPTASLHAAIEGTKNRTNRLSGKRLLDVAGVQRALDTLHAVPQRVERDVNFLLTMRVGNRRPGNQYTP